MKSLSEIKDEKYSEEVLIELKDVTITRIYEDYFANGGCETCDWGSSYGYEYDFTFSDETTFTVKLGDMYDSPVSEGDLMIFFLNNLEEIKEMTKEEFKLFMQEPKNILGYEPY